MIETSASVLISWPVSTSMAEGCTGCIGGVGSLWWELGTSRTDAPGLSICGDSDSGDGGGGDVCLAFALAFAFSRRFSFCQ